MYILEYKFNSREIKKFPELSKEWKFQGIIFGTIEEAENSANRLIGALERTWRIIYEGKIVKEKPEPNVEEKEEILIIEDDFLPKLLENINKTTENWDKENKLLYFIFFHNEILQLVGKHGSSKEKNEWTYLTYTSLINDILPYIEKLEMPEDLFLEVMKENIIQVNLLRYLKLVTAAQAKEMYQNIWLLGDANKALLALKLNEEVKEDNLLEIVIKVVESNQKVIEDYCKGKVNSANSLIGHVVKIGKINNTPIDPVKTKELIIKVLEKYKNE